MALCVVFLIKIALAALETIAHNYQFVLQGLRVYGLTAHIVNILIMIRGVFPFHPGQGRGCFADLQAGKGQRGEKRKVF
jgi:hypothetical protein